MSSRPGFPLLLPSNVTKGKFVDDQGILSDPVRRFLTDLPRAQALKIRSRFSLTHVKRLANPAGQFAEGTLCYESDRGVTYIAEENVWLYHTGTMQCLQADLPSDLAANDAGLLAFVTDYAHLLRWNGTGWDWAPGEHGSGYTQSFLIDPGTGWQACDGSAGVATLLSDGSLDYSVTVPNTAGSWYRQ